MCFALQASLLTAVANPARTDAGQGGAVAILTLRGAFTSMVK